jgi:hypothetical protein
MEYGGSWITRHLPVHAYLKQLAQLWIYFGKIIKNILSSGYDTRIGII